MPDFRNQLNLLNEAESGLVDHFNVSLHADNNRRMRELARGAFQFGESLRGSPAQLNSDSVVRVIADHPALRRPEREGIYFDLIVRGSDPGVAKALDDARQDALEVIIRGTIAAAAGSTPDGYAEALIATAIGADFTSRTLRSALLGKVSPDPAGPPDPRFPDISLIDRTTLDRLVLWGTIRAFQNLGRATGSYADWAARAYTHANGIRSTDPPILLLGRSFFLLCALRFEGQSAKSGGRQL